MLSSTLATIGQLIKLHDIIDSNLADRFLSLLAHYHVDNWLYPGVITRKLGITITKAYDLLKILEGEGYIELYYELYCSQCHKYSGIVVKTIEEIPDFFKCESCDSEMIGIENAIIIFKVISE